MREYERFKELMKDIPRVSEMERRKSDLIRMSPNGWGFDIFYYKNPVAEGDVVGHLTADEAIEMAKEIASWNRDQKWEDYEEDRE